MKVTYDKEARALYIYIIEGDYERQKGWVELSQDTVFLDKTKLGQIAGIEVLGVDKIEVLGENPDNKER